MFAAIDQFMASNMLWIILALVAALVGLAAEVRRLDRRCDILVLMLQKRSRPIE